MSTDFVMCRVPRRQPHNDVRKVGTLLLVFLGQSEFPSPRGGNRRRNGERDAAAGTRFQRPTYRLAGIFHYMQGGSRIVHTLR